MSLGLLVGVGLLGGLGSLARLLLDGRISRRCNAAFPYGTFAVNMSGALVLGVLAGVGLGHDAFRLAGVGLVGGYTTFSTWVLESHRLAEHGGTRVAAANIAVSVLAGLAAVWLGRELGMAL